MCYLLSSSIKVLSLIKERKQSTSKGNNPLWFEKRIFRNDQPVRDDGNNILVAIPLFQLHPFLQAHLNIREAHNHRIENCSVTEHHLYIESWNERFGLISYVYFTEAQKGSMPVEIIRRVAEHNLFSLENHAPVETLVHQTGKIWCR